MAVDPQGSTLLAAVLFILKFSVKTELMEVLTFYIALDSLSTRALNVFLSPRSIASWTRC